MEINVFTSVKSKLIYLFENFNNKLYAKKKPKKKKKE